MTRLFLALAATLAVAAPAAPLAAQAAPQAGARPATPPDTGKIAGDVRAFIQTVSASDAPFAMRTQTLRRLDQVLAQAATDPADAVTLLAEARATFREQMALVADFDALSAKIYDEAPAGFPDFIQNSRTEFARFRGNVGNPAGYASRDALNAVRVDYQRRVAMMRLLAEVRDGIASLDAGARAPLQASFDLHLAAVQQYEGGKPMDEAAIRQLHKEVVKPKA